MKSWLEIEALEGMDFDVSFTGFDEQEIADLLAGDADDAHTGEHAADDDIKEGRISMVINTTNHGRDAERDGFKIRRSTVEHAIACLTSMDTARELQHVMSAMRRRRVVSIVALQDLAWEG